jgi:hypothetical protein
MSSYDYQCRGTTQRGANCSRESGLVGGYCHQHQHQRDPEERLNRIRRERERLERERLEREQEQEQEQEQQRRPSLRFSLMVMKEHYDNQFVDCKTDTWRMERC